MVTVKVLYNINPIIHFLGTIPFHTRKTKSTSRIVILTLILIYKPTFRKLIQIHIFEQFVNDLLFVKLWQEIMFNY